MNIDEFFDEPTDLIKVEENTLILAEKMQERLIDLETQKSELESLEKGIKEQLKELMSKYNITSYETNDKKLKISYTPETITTTFDSKKLFEEQPDIYRQYAKDTTRSSSVRITIRGDK